MPGWSGRSSAGTGAQVDVDCRAEIELNEVLWVGSNIFDTFEESNSGSLSLVGGTLDHKVQTSHFLPLCP